MSVIIRLQNLPWDANAIDIRRYFQGLSIPDGGVHIVGGEKGDAFIAFTTDEDARLAMQKDGGRINSVQIKLFLSSKTEMQNVIAAAKVGGPISTAPSTRQLTPSSAPFGSQAQSDSQRGYGSFQNDRSRDLGGHGEHSGNKFGVSGRNDQIQHPPTCGFADPSRDGQRTLPFQTVPEHRQSIDLSGRPLITPGDTRFHGSGSPPKSRFLESGPGIRDTLSSVPFGPSGRIPDPYRPGEHAGSDRRQFVQHDADSRFDDRRSMSNFKDWSSESRDISFRDTRSVGSFHQSEDTRMFGKPDMRRDYEAKLGPPSSFAGGDGMIKSGWHDDRSSRSDGTSDLVCRPETNSRILADMPPLQSHELPRFELPGPPRFRQDAGPPANQDPVAFRKTIPNLMRIDVKKPMTDKQAFEGLYNHGNVAVKDTLNKMHEIPEGIGGVTAKCSNFPKMFNYKEIRRYFAKSGCDIPFDGLKIINDHFGMRSGIVYVRFSNSHACANALSLSGSVVENFKLKVEPCSVQEYENVADGSVAPSVKRKRSRSPPSTNLQNSFKYQPKTFFFVVKRILPNVDRNDVKRFFGQFCIVCDGGPFLEIGADGQATGNALVALEKLRNTNEVLSSLHKARLNGSPVDVIHVGRDEYIQRIRQSQSDSIVDKEKVDNKPDNKQKEGPRRSRSKESETAKRSLWIHLKGIPFHTTPAVIEDFFRDLDIAKNSIRIVLNREGRAAGDAFVELSNSTDYKKALARDRERIGHRYVEIRPISKQAVFASHQTLQKQCGGPPVVEDERSGPIHDLPNEVDPDVTVCMQNLHPETQLEDILDFFNAYHPVVDSIKLQYKNGKPTGDGLVAFRTHWETVNAVRTKNRQFLLGRQILLSCGSEH